MAIKKIEMNQKRTDGGYDILHPVTSVENVVGAETPAGAQAKANEAENNAKGHANWLIGDLGQLQTGNKSNIVSAMNETFQSGVRAKNDVVAALNAKKIPATINDPWATLASKIGQIRTDIKMATDGGLLSEKTLDVNNLNFEPIIVYVRMGLSGQGEGYWITSSPGLLFVKDNSSLSQEYGEVKAYIRMEHYLSVSARITWKSNGFTVNGSVSGSHEYQNFGFSRWCAFGI
ncbi:hypothetical protein [Paenibacillus alvei]|uniref:hypothetical protein n=1 Tax=Paenibacillus alvei TaxID=44250 RepID=UPI001F5125CF|nr:hypothetical protein [Paenibacillus alvei]MBG9734544.1 hypothetical protein [Paenibacillus alvei]MBG9743145.1 hypothetical protein [Paenibacillus alvei]MCY9579548.1 hypothetical protein [Paenibacillus alvei]MCY9586508.1 hypothetical protein [Paenibacillus alvei]